VTCRAGPLSSLALAGAWGVGSLARSDLHELHPGQVRADALDAQLHAERVDPVTRERRFHEAPLDELPDGVFVLREANRGWC